MPNMRPPHALSGGRLAALGATRGSTTGCWRGQGELPGDRPLRTVLENRSANYTQARPALYRLPSVRRGKVIPVTVPRTAVDMDLPTAARHDPSLPSSERAAWQGCSRHCPNVLVPQAWRPLRPRAGHRGADSRSHVEVGAQALLRIGDLGPQPLLRVPDLRSQPLPGIGDLGSQPLLRTVISIRSRCSVACRSSLAARVGRISSIRLTRRSRFSVRCSSSRGSVCTPFSPADGRGRSTSRSSTNRGTVRRGIRRSASRRVRRRLPSARD